MTATQRSLFGYPVPPSAIDVHPSGGVRRTDPETSHEVAHDPVARVAWTGERLRLLRAFNSDEATVSYGLTDEAAATIANRSGKYIDPAVESTRRAAELRDAGLIELTGAKRPKASGRRAQVSRITAAGRMALRGKG